MLSNVYRATGGKLRLARGRGGPYFSPSRKRDRPIRIPDRQALRTLLVSRAVPVGGRREDVQESGQFLYPSRPGAQGAQALFHPLSVKFSSLPEPTEFHFRRTEAGGDFGRSFAQLPTPPDHGKAFPRRDSGN